MSTRNRAGNDFLHLNGIQMLKKLLKSSISDDFFDIEIIIYLYRIMLIAIIQQKISCRIHDFLKLFL